MIVRPPEDISRNISYHYSIRNIPFPGSAILNMKPKNT
jgi:hypothetical protein